MKIRMALALLLTMCIVAVSWITNFGFIRLFCTSMLLPFVHAIIVFAIFAVIINYVDCKKIRVYHFLFLITYLMSNVFFADVDEVDNLMFFGLIHNEILCNIGNVVSVISLILHIVFIILQIVEVRRIDKIREKTGSEI